MSDNAEYGRAAAELIGVADTIIWHVYIINLLFHLSIIIGPRTELSLTLPMRSCRTLHYPTLTVIDHHQVYLFPLQHTVRNLALIPP